MPNDTDLKLVELVKKGDRQAFTMLVETHQRPLYGLIFKFVKNHSLTDDIIQDTFVKAYKKIASFEGRSSFKSWLFRIGINNAKNMTRAKKSIEINDQDVVLQVESKAGESVERKQIKEMLTKEIEKLPKKQKLALTLRIFDDLPFKEIAEIMECPYDTAKANFRHAISNLRKQSKLLNLFGTA